MSPLDSLLVIIQQPRFKSRVHPAFMICPHIIPHVVGISEPVHIIVNSTHIPSVRSQSHMHIQANAHAPLEWYSLWFSEYCILCVGRATRAPCTGCTGVVRVLRICIGRATL